ncbi:MAG: four helix bundle protein [Patescibacteria group bacterium]
MVCVENPNNKFPISNQIQNQNNKKQFNLVERTARFGEKIIDFAKTINKNLITRSLIIQLVKAATSIGANYMEADCAESRKDFRHKIGICKKEAKETSHWLRMVAKANPELSNECRKLWQEAHELTLIFSAIRNKTK